MFKTIITIVAMCAVGIASALATEGVRSMTISLADNTTIDINLSKDLTTTFADDNLSITGSNTNVLLALSEVEGWSYSTEKASNVTDITTNINTPIIERDPSTLVLSNLPEKSAIALYSVKGGLIREFNSSERTTIALDELAHGVYILSVNGYTIKFSK